MLVLFDIDGTLLVSEQVGVRAMIAAGRQLFGDDFTLEGVEIAGRLDPLIMTDAGALLGIEDMTPHLAQFRRLYEVALRELLARDNSARPCTGVPELIDAVEATPNAILGVVTGNFPETGRLKIAAAGIDPDRFVICAWGCDGPTRRDLPAHALVLCNRGRNVPIKGEQTIVIGDTPHDADCARHNGCRSIGVATGGFTVRELRESGFDLVVDDLRETEPLVSWMMERRGTMLSSA